MKKELHFIVNLKKQNSIYFILFCVCFFLIGCSTEVAENDLSAEVTEYSLSVDATEDNPLSDTIDDTGNIYGQGIEDRNDVETVQDEQDGTLSLDELPEYTGNAYVILNDNQPDFTEAEKQNTDAFEYYSELDSLGRCGVAFANICPELKPTEKRDSIGQIRPSGWHTVKYSDIIEDNYLYNRCHLIGYQLAGENANEKNLITGTRYLNVTGMLSFENEVSDYVDSTGNHVLYRVTPVFEGNNAVASGVQMEAWSVEDAGQGVCFNVYCYNVQPGIGIDYATGESWENFETSNFANESDIVVGTDIATGFKLETGTDATSGTSESDVSGAGETEKYSLIINTNTGKFHLPNCPSVNKMKEHNKQFYTGTIQELINQGYSPCKNCLDAYSKESK